MRMLPIVTAIVLLAACDPTLDIKRSGGDAPEKTSTRQDEKLADSERERAPDDRPREREQEPITNDASNDKDYGDDTQAPQPSDPTHPEEECDEESEGAADDAQPTPDDCDCSDEPAGRETELEDREADQAEVDDASAEEDECMCDDAEDEGAASLDDSWDLCVETVGECETLEIACLQDMSTCLKDANADTTCLDEGIACLQAGGSDDDCLSAFDICLEAQSTDDLDIAPDNGPNTTDAPDEGEADVASTDLLAIGDSMLEWNIWDNGSIPEVAAKLAGMTVTNAAIGGAQFLPEDGIPSQYIPGDYKAVIVNGGANDLGDGCVCGSCLSQVDAIVNSTAQTGAMVDLVNTLTVGATEVVLIGYFKPMPGSEFEGCEQERIALNTRYASIAAARPTVIFVDPSTVMTPTATPEFYAEDKIHPSVTGSAAIGELVAQALTNQ